ncbi:MAG: RNA polymerase sigma factor [Pirellulales bacterium]
MSGEQGTSKETASVPEDVVEVVEQCLAGDQAAMADLVRRYQGQVFGLCYRMLADRQDAEDMAQETFVRVLRSLERWDNARAFEPWLLAIAGNRCRTLLATRKRRPDTSPIVADVPARGYDAEDQDHQALAEEVSLGLADIRDEYRQAFLMFHQHELSYGDIAESMNCPLGTVKTWIHRARRELIDYLRSRGIVEETSHAV